MTALSVRQRGNRGGARRSKWLKIALFVWRFHGPWLTFKRAVDAEDWPSAGATLNRIRQIIAVNLPLGLLVVVIGGSGRYWG